MFAGAGEPASFQHYLNLQIRPLDGVYLAGPRADDPEAWCFYSRDVVERCMSRLSDSGVMMLHVRAGAGGLGDLLAVAQTFEVVAGRSTAAVTVVGDAVEMLLVARSWNAAAGPPDELADPGEGVRVVPLAGLLAGLSGQVPKPISALAPRPWSGPGPSVDQFAAALESTSRTKPAGGVRPPRSNP